MLDTLLQCLISSWSNYESGDLPIKPKKLPRMRRGRWTADGMPKPLGAHEWQGSVSVAQKPSGWKHFRLVYLSIKLAWNQKENYRNLENTIRIPRSWENTQLYPDEFARQINRLKIVPIRTVSVPRKPKLPSRWRCLITPLVICE